MKTKVAVLDDTHLYVEPDTVIELPELHVNAAFLCELGLKHNLHCIWILPGCQFSHDAMDTSLFVPEYDVRIGYRENSTVPVFGSAKRESGTCDEKRLVNFGLPEHDPRWMEDGSKWALADVEDPLDLLTCMSSLEAALIPKKVTRGCLEQGTYHVSWSPGHSGTTLVGSVLKLYDHAGWAQKYDMSMLPLDVEQDIIWKRPLTEQELTGKQYLHVFDRNSMYLAAGTGAVVGDGAPSYVAPEHIAEITPESFKIIPGVWHIDVYDIPHVYGSKLPAIKRGKQWAYSSTAEMLIDCNVKFTIEEGYQWPVHHRTLQEWANHLWKARQHLKRTQGKNSPAYKMMKIICTQTVGWFDLTANRVKRIQKKPTAWYDRPDWSNPIKSLARRRMMLTINEVTKQGLYPHFVYIDAIGYISTEATAEAAVPGIMRRSEELGGFKHAGTYEVTPELIALFLDSVEENQLLESLKRLEKVSV